jgi:hypothetical protein
LKTWCILINSVFMKLPIYPTTEEFNSVCPEKLKKMFPRCIDQRPVLPFILQMNRYFYNYTMYIFGG